MDELTVKGQRDTTGNRTVIPLPAAVWAGMVLMGLMGGQHVLRRRRGN